jgi:predicted NUDIX family NTP pyrophosphohydrolase
MTPTPYAPAARVIIPGMAKQGKPAGGADGRLSAGVVLWRRRDGRIEVLLGHPGGPFFAKKDLDNWTVPKGEVEPGEELLAVALREFEEETGHDVPDVDLIPLGEILQKGGKTVVAWGAEGDLDPEMATSNEYEMEWPPRSGRMQTFPEIDRVDWFDLPTARTKVKAAQVPLLDRLEQALAPSVD